MYVTRPLSHYLSSPELLSQPPAGPNSGYLVFQDQESDRTLLLGLVKDHRHKSLPFPQDKDLIVHYSDDNDHEVALIPVLNQPLFSGQYYAIKPHGSHKGDVDPRPFDPDDIYQRFQIVPYEAPIFTIVGTFYVISVAPDGVPPNILRRKGWAIRTKTPKNCKLGEAPGINNALRARLPEFDFWLSSKSSATIGVGKWYCPFMFVRDGTLKDQMERSRFYTMTLEQRWEQIFVCESDHYSRGNSVTVDIELPRDVVFVGGREAVLSDERNVAHGMFWYRSFGAAGEELVSIGLSSLIVSRMKWEQGRAGWVSSEERQARVKRTEEYAGKLSGGWSRFGLYVLVESFVLKRMDGSLVLTYNFKHTHQIRSKWE